MPWTTRNRNMFGAEGHAGGFDGPSIRVRVKASACLIDLSCDWRLRT